MKRPSNKPVQLDSGAPTFDNFALPLQQPVSKVTIKPMGNVPMKEYAIGFVPLKPMQFGSEPFVELHVGTAGDKLRTVQPKATRITMETTMEVIPGKLPVYEQNLGIRPGERSAP